MDVVPPPPIGSVELLGNAGTAVNVRLVGLAPATFLAGFWLARRLRARRLRARRPEEVDARIGRGSADPSAVVTP